MQIEIGTKFTIKSNEISNLLVVLQEMGYQTIGPKIMENTIIYDEIDSMNDLPVGWTDEQEKGSYSLKKTGDNSLFGYTVGPYTWKKYLFPPVESIFKAKKEGKNFKILEKENKEVFYAFIGVRACEINAINIQDKIFIEGEYINPEYKQVRNNIFIVAVNCSKAGNTCFCLSMEAGPEVKKGYDLLLTEINNSPKHFFVIEAGSSKGLEILQKLEFCIASVEEISELKKVINSTKKQMGRELNLPDVKKKLAESYDNPYWNEIANRCLTCTNCTMVCPTCFCSSVEDVTDLTGEYAERIRKWDSCFTLDYSYIHGNTVRKTSASRYRQWLTHKFSTWIDQFGVNGCVGCGRCITWCPVGIDVTEEIKKLIDKGR